MRALSIFIAALLSLTLSACSPESTDKKITTPAPLKVTTMLAHASDETLWIDTLGRIETESDIELRAQVTGLLKKIYFNPGQWVKKGEVLFELESDGLRESLNQAKQVEKEMLAEKENAAKELEREEKLFTLGATSQKSLFVAKALEQKTKARLMSARAKIKEIQTSLAHTRIIAPHSGFVSQSLVNPGALVTAQSTLLATLTNPNRLRVVFSPSERDLARYPLSHNNPVFVMTAEGKRVDAKIDYVASRLNRETNTLSIRATLSASTLKSGAFVRAHLGLATQKGVFAVPQKAIRQRPDGLYSVFLVDGGKAKEQLVTLGQWVGTDWIVTKGLKEKDAIILDQQQKLRDGLTVSQSPRAKD